MKKLDLQYPQCSIRNVLNRIGDKWYLLILCSLGVNGQMRYKELMNAIPDISHKMLTNTLKNLEADHLIIRKSYPEIPPRVEYSLTKMGESLIPIIQSMINWPQDHFDEFTDISKDAETSL